MDAKSQAILLQLQSERLCKLATALRETLGRFERPLTEPQQSNGTSAGNPFAELVTLNDQLFDTTEIFHRQLCRFLRTPPLPATPRES